MRHLWHTRENGCGQALQQSLIYTSHNNSATYHSPARAIGIDISEL